MMGVKLSWPQKDINLEGINKSSIDADAPPSIQEAIKPSQANGGVPKTVIQRELQTRISEEMTKAINCAVSADYQLHQWDVESDAEQDGDDQ